MPETLRGFCTAAWDPSVAREPAAGGTPVEARVLVSQNNSNFQVPMVCRITTAAEWEAFRREAAWTGIPPLPEVDFGRTVLLAAAQGWKSSTGYRIDIARVRARGDTLEAVVQPHEPPDGSTVGAEETSPVVVVALGARRSDVRFVWPVR
ncbi:MAG TPA: protease complex subunit PrcB family protein [Longimicrobium sp.]|nr:protease complex subunit PrcB family protein [Longimicrobium sp.]